MQRPLYHLVRNVNAVCGFANLWESARFERVDERVLAIADFTCEVFSSIANGTNESLFRRDAETGNLAVVSDGNPKSQTFSHIRKR